MAKRMLPMEELARDICWSGFNQAPGKKVTATSYWASLPLDTRKHYLAEAKAFISTVRRLKLSRVVKACEEIS